MTARKRPPAVLVDEDPGNVHLRSSSIMGRAGVITLCGWTDVAHSVKRGPAATCGRCLSVLVMCQEMAPPAPLPRAVRELLRDVVKLDYDEESPFTRMVDGWAVPSLDAMALRAARILGTTPAAIIARARKVRK